MKTSIYFSILSSLALTTSTVSLAQAQEQAPSNTISVSSSSLLRTTTQKGAKAAAQSSNTIISKTSSTLTQSRDLKSSKALVPSPGLLWYQYLQNKDFGTIDPTKYDIDLSLQVVNQATTDAFVRARNRWMKVITGDVLDINVGDILDSLPGEVVESDVDFCDNPLPEVIDDVHICGTEVEIDGKGIFGNIIGYFSPGLSRDPSDYPVT